MTVDPEAIKLVLEQSTVAKAAELDPKAIFRQLADPRGQPRLRREIVSRPGKVSRDCALAVMAGESQQYHPPGFRLCVPASRAGFLLEAR